MGFAVTCIEHYYNGRHILTIFSMMYLSNGFNQGLSGFEIVASSISTDDSECAAQNHSTIYDFVEMRIGYGMRREYIFIN